MWLNKYHPTMRTPGTPNAQATIYFITILLCALLARAIPIAFVLPSGLVGIGTFYLLKGSTLACELLRPRHWLGDNPAGQERTEKADKHGQ
jgi:hypothetical protein